MLCGLPKQVTIAYISSFISSEDEMKQRKWIVAGIFLAGICAVAAHMRFAEVVKADDVKPAAKTEPWKAEDVIFQEFVTQMRISPDSKWLVWVKSIGDKEK